MSLANDLEAALDAAVGEGIEKIVVGAIISKGDQVLVLRRREDDFLGGLDELPSGHVEDGEGLPDALRREVKEETGLELNRILHLVGRFDYLTKSRQRARQLNFVVDVKRSSGITLSEHSAYCCVDPNGVEALNLTPSVRAVLDRFWAAS